MLETRKRSIVWATMVVLLGFSCASSNFLLERIHIHIGCIGSQDEEECKGSMGAKGEWKGYLARGARASSSWWHSQLDTGGTAGSRRVTQLQVRAGVCLNSSTSLEGVYTK